MGKKTQRVDTEPDALLDGQGCHSEILHQERAFIVAPMAWVDNLRNNWEKKCKTLEGQQQEEVAKSRVAGKQISTDAAVVY